ncbi:MAG TPA: IPT/TIG domain-containing protein [Thermoanaerobaculia bacterium]|jgi:hypothetical protein
MFAKFGVRPGWTRAYVNSSSRPQVESIVAASGSELLWIYPTRALVYTPRFQTLQTKAIEAGTTATQAKDIVDTFEVNGILVDPANDVPAEDDFREYSSKLGLYVLQFAGKYDPAMAAQLAALGVTVVTDAETSDNAVVVQASLGDVRKTDALPWLAYRDLLHPRWKGPRRTIIDERYYSAAFDVARTAPDANRIAQQLALPSHAGGSDGFNYLGADVKALFEHPLVLSVLVEDSEVEIYGVLPAQGPPGSQIILNVSDSLDVDEVRFNGVPAQFTRIDVDRVRATVPALPNGPAEIVVYRNDGWRQVLPSRAGYGFHVAERLGETTFARGDLIAVTQLDQDVSGPPLLVLEWFTPEGELRRTRGTETIPGQLFFSTQGFLNGTRGDEPFVYDAFLERAGEGAAFLKGASSVTIARDGTFFVLAGSALRRHAANGDLQNSGSLPLTRTIDLAADQCTLVAAGADGLQLYDGCRMQTLGVIRVGSFTMARFLPDGTILAGSEDGSLVRLTTGGGVLFTEQVGSGFRFAIAADGNFVWIAHDRQIDRFDLALNERTTTRIDVGVVNTLTVYGEWTAARGDATYDNPIVVTEVQGFDNAPGTLVTITGRGWLPGAQVTIGGVAVPNANVESGRITFAMPNGAKSSREIVIRNPNGQRGLFTVPARGKFKRRAV